MLKSMLLVQDTIYRHTIAYFAYSFGHLVPSLFFGLAYAPIVETRFFDLAVF